MSSPAESACSGLMYEKVPRIVPTLVYMLPAVSRCEVAFTRPKSLISHNVHSKRTPPASLPRLWQHR